MTPTAFLDTDLQVMAARARTALPAAVNGRIEKAVRLVQAASVEFHDDGTATVLSESDGVTSYRVVGKSCACPDYTFQAPQGGCAHRIAVAMVQRLIAAQAETAAPRTIPEPSAAPNATTEPLGASTAVAVPSLPEAPASVNCHITVAGRQVQITLRDSDERRLLTRLEAVLVAYPAPTTPVSASAGEAKLCPMHNVPMKLNAGKEGRKPWWSHKTSEGWCQGRLRR